MEGKESLGKIEEKYKEQISQLKARFIAEKEELTTLFLEKLKEVENYHKKMLQDLVIKSSSDLDAIQAKHEEKVKFLTALHSKELESLQSRVEALQAEKEELKGMLGAVCEGESLPKEKVLRFLANDSKNMAVSTPTPVHRRKSKRVKSRCSNAGEWSRDGEEAAEDKEDGFRRR